MGTVMVYRVRVTVYRVRVTVYGNSYGDGDGDDDARGVFWRTTWVWGRWLYFGIQLRGQRR